MQNYVDDSELAKILTEANQVMSGIAGKKEMNSQEMMEIARRIASSTNTYTGLESSPVTHFVERSARKVKSKIGLHIDMLKSTASNISLMKERIHGGLERPTSKRQEVHSKGASDSDQLEHYNHQIDETLKYLKTKTMGKTQIEEKIKKYRDIMGDLEGTLKELPKNIKEGKVKKTKALDHKLAEKVDIKAGEVMKRMQEMAPPRLKFGWEGYSTDEDEEGIGDWINHEGFNNKEDLERYNEIFKEFVGEYPNEYERRNIEEGYYDKDGMGRAIDRTKAGRQRRRGLYSPRNNDLAETEALTKCKEMEKNLRDVLSRAKNTNGDPEVGSVISERRFLDTYMEKKMETVHTTDGSQNNDTTDKKKYNIRKIPTKKKTEDEEKKICIDGPVRRGTPADDGDTSSPARSSRKSVMIPVTSSSNSIEKKKQEEVVRPKTSDDLKAIEEHNINWDMDRIKKLIVKERQEALRKKREAWERNNELSEEMIDREKMLAIRRGLHQPFGPFDVPIPSAKPSSSDFITDRERHEKMYRKAVKGRDGVYHKDDLDYEFGVNPFYYEPEKNKEEGGDSKDVPISIRSYRGVRKKAEV